MKFFYALLLHLLVSGLSAQSYQTYYPTANVDWKNIKTDYGAVGDGITDDTEAFRAAVATYLNPYNSSIAIFIPKGTYLVSDSICFLQGYYDCCLTLQGEDPDLTVIKLKDEAADFQDPLQSRPIFFTRAGNQAFGNYIFNLTINTGISNEGAVGIDYITSNYGAMRQVRVISPDGSGYCGIAMERNWPGPGLLKQVQIEGFQYGIRVGSCEYSMTFEDITLRNQSVAGITNACNTICMRHLSSYNSVPAIKNESARIILLDSQLNGGDSSQYGIEITGYSFVFARNIQSNGYAGALSVDGVPIQGNNVTEYHNLQDYSLFANDGKSLGLPIEETPEYINNNPQEWASVADFGAAPTNPLYGFNDATDEIQAAFNSGKKAIHFGQIGDNGTYYCVYSDIVIPSGVELITGLNLGKILFFNNSKFVVQEDASSPLFLERIKGIVLENNSQRTIVFRHVAGAAYRNTLANTNAKVFLEDWVDRFEPQYPVQMWARHLNTEVQPEEERNIDNPGGKYWILGLKTEGRANIVRTTQGGATEILGGLIYPASSFSGENQTAFTVENACMSLAGLTMTSYVNNGWYGQAVKETQGYSSAIRSSNDIWTQSAYNFSFYSSSKIACSTSGLPGERTPDLHEIMVYPNPVSDDFEIKTKDIWEQAVLYNSFGQIVRVFSNISKPTLAGFQSGLYFLAVYGHKNEMPRLLRLIKK